MFAKVRLPISVVLSLITVLVGLPGFAESIASTFVAPRVNGLVDESNRMVLRGNVHPLAKPGSDLGPVEDSFPAERLLLLLKRSDEQETALREFIQAQHTPGDPSFHQWLKPEEFGRLYGPADSDVVAVTAWLEAHGFAINRIPAGRVAIEFSGTAAQVREAFHSGIHRYAVNGEIHVANAQDPEVPAALAPVIAGLAPMNDFHVKPMLKVLGRAEFDGKTHEVKPDWTYPVGGSVFLALAPGDFAVQYDLNPVYKSGITGTGQSIAIISESNVDLSLVGAYQSLFGLKANLPEVVVDGSDPGQNSAATEAYLDIELSGAVAPGATVILYTSGGTAVSDGLNLAAVRAVEDNVAGVISTSYGECEVQLGQSGNAFWNAIWQQAAAQGQTAFVASGDSGSAACDNIHGPQVNGLGSTPYNVSVGGTDFYYSDYSSASKANAQLTTYWSGLPNGTASVEVSLQKPVPEQVWNDVFGYNLVSNGNPADVTQSITAGGGGRSNDAVYASGALSGVGYAKPTWQVGTGVPTDKVRDLPDVSLYASYEANRSFYPICAEPGDCTTPGFATNAMAVTGVGGTSASSPAMAAIQALVDQSTKSRQGQADFIYYPLAVKEPSVFHDVTLGGNEVLCTQGTPGCVAGEAGSITSGFYVENGYPAGKGYDLASGLGSVDVANLIKYWSTVTLKPTRTTLSVSPSSFVHGTTTTLISTVAPSTGTGTPSGFVNLTSNDGISHYASIDDFSLSKGDIRALVDNLPGGAYQLNAVYGGDGIFAPSKSAPVSITVTAENDTLTSSGWAVNPSAGALYRLAAGATVPYGSQIILDAQPVSTHASLTGQGTAATGTVTFTDKMGSTAVTSVQPLNDTGVAEWFTGVFAPGSHTVNESYSGDPSYNPSTNIKAANFTVTRGNTYLSGGSLASTVVAGTSVTVHVGLSEWELPLYGKLPTGDVTVTVGRQSKTVPWQAFGQTGNSYLEALVTFPNVPAGTLPVTASYAGDANWLGSSLNAGTVISSPSTKLTPTVTLTTNSNNPSLGQTVWLTGIVSGPTSKSIPTGTVTMFLYYGWGWAAETAPLSIDPSNAEVAFFMPGYYNANGATLYAILYNGDANYNAVLSNTVDIQVSKADFSLTTLKAEIAIAPAKSGTSTLVLTPIDGFSGTIALTASVPAGITVTPATASPKVSATSEEAVTITVASSAKSGTYPVAITATGGGHVHSALIQILVP